MIRTKLGLLGLCAVALGIMAMSASSAQSATLSWLILNSAGTTATELLASLESEKSSPHIVYLFKILKQMVSLTCVDVVIFSFNLSIPGVLELPGQLSFRQCGLYFGAAPLGEKLPCTVKTAGQSAGTILTNKLKGKLVLHTLAGGGTEVLAEVAPEVGTTFATLLFEGEECALPAENPVSGTVFVKDGLKQATTHVVKHLVEQGPLTSLTIGADTAEHLESSVIGNAWVKLGKTPAGVDHTGLKWAAMDA